MSSILEVNYNMTYKSFSGIKTFSIGTADINVLLVSVMGQPADNSYSFIVALFRKSIGTPSSKVGTGYIRFLPNLRSLTTK